MAPGQDVFHPDYKPLPYWWEAYRPVAGELTPVPRQAQVAIIGAGYAGLSAALELARNGIQPVVLDANEPGFGASTRNGGGVGGGIGLGKSFTGKTLDRDPATVRALVAAAWNAFEHVETLVRREAIDCHWERRGNFTGAWTRSHFEGLKQRLSRITPDDQSQAYLVPRERQREEIGTDLYHGGLVIERAAQIHPALYFKGLLDACERNGVIVCAKAPVHMINPGDGSAQRRWRLGTGRGDVEAAEVVVTTNGYTGNATPKLKRGLVPVASHIIATEELPAELARSVSPKRRTLADTRRVLNYYRLSPDGRRMVFGGRPRFTHVEQRVSALLLYEQMLERFPQLRGTRITHAWSGGIAFTFDALPHMGRLDGMHYCLGCNGSGIARMTYLGHQTARKILTGANAVCAFDLPELPEFPLYNGNPWFLPVVGGYFRLRDRIDRLIG